MSFLGQCLALLYFGSMDGCGSSNKKSGISLCCGLFISMLQQNRQAALPLKEVYGWGVSELMTFNDRCVTCIEIIEALSAFPMPYVASNRLRSGALALVACGLSLYTGGWLPSCPMKEFKIM